MSNEDNLKLALETLKIKSETEKMNAEIDKTRVESIADGLKTVMQTFMPFVKIAITSSIPPQVMTVTRPPFAKEDILFFADTCTKEGLEALIKDLTNILDEKQREKQQKGG